MASRQCYPGSMSGYNQEQYYEEERSYNSYGANGRPAGGYNTGMGMGMGNSHSNHGHGGYGKNHGSYNTYGGQSLGYGNSTHMNGSQNGLGYGNSGNTLTHTPNGQHIGHLGGHRATTGTFQGGYRGTTLTRKNRYRIQGKSHTCNHRADDSCSSDSSDSSDDEHHGRRRSYC